MQEGSSTCPFGVLMATNLFTLGTFLVAPNLVTVQAGVDSVSSKVTSIVVTDTSMQACTVTAGPLGNPAQWITLPFPANSTTTRTLTQNQSNNIGVVNLAVEPPIGNLYLSAQLVGG